MLWYIENLSIFVKLYIKNYRADEKSNIADFLNLCNQEY